MEECHHAYLKPFRILVSLLDKPEIGELRKQPFITRLAHLVDSTPKWSKCPPLPAPVTCALGGSGICLEPSRLGQPGKLSGRGALQGVLVHLSHTLGLKLRAGKEAGEDHKQIPKGPSYLSACHRSQRLNSARCS